MYQVVKRDGKVVDFDISSFIGVLVHFSGKHTFIMKVRDDNPENNKYYELPLKITVE